MAKLINHPLNKASWQALPLMRSKQQPGIPLNTLEKRALSGISTIFALRMVGLFMFMPVLALYAESIEGVTSLQIGLAVGIYGLTQAGLQIPMGMASDRWGRKRIIAIGLLVFIFGSIFAALASSINELIIGRAIQGAGAIAAAMSALTADLTRENQRTKAMAIIGVTIGGSFTIALLLGPMLQLFIGISGMFWLAAAMAVMALITLFLWVPKPTHLPAPRRDVFAQLQRVFRNGQLMRLNVGIFFLHSIMTALFIAVPLSLVKFTSQPATEIWQIYLPTLIGGVILMIPMIGIAERKQKMRLMFLVAITLILLSQIILATGYESLIGLVLGLFVFFIGFNFLEAAIPSLISRAAGLTNRGTAMGVFSTFEFFGAFVGGAMAGILHGQLGFISVFVFSASLIICWFILAWTMKVSAPLQSQTVPAADLDDSQLAGIAATLGAITGVAEAVADSEAGVVHLRLDEKNLDKASLDKALAAM